MSGATLMGFTSIRNHMRAIAGFCSFDNRIAPGLCLTMLRILSGSAATVQPEAPGVVLGSCDYGPDPIFSPGKQLRRSNTQGRPSFVADLRIDNHDDLVRELDLPEGASDEEVLAQAWARWNFSVVDHVIGGFAIACWDPQRRTLFLARDHSGERPLHFTRSLGPQGSFAFASLPPGLCVLPSVGHRINVERMAHYLAALSARGTETFFEGVERLPPAHWIKVSPAGIEMRRYWDPVGTRPIRYARDADYIEDFCERFDRAVAARISGHGDTASQLSGGLDSSSVTVTAARLLSPTGGRITSFTAVPIPGYDGSALPGRFGDEGGHAAEVAALYPNIDHVRVDVSGRDLLVSASRDMRMSGQPTFNPTNMLWIDAILDTMRSRGIGVLLHGAGGNNTVSFGGLIGLSELLRSGRWIKLIRLTHEMRGRGHTSWRGAASWATGWLVPQWLRRFYHPEMRNFSLAYSAVHPDIAAEYRLRERAMAGFFGAENSTAAVRRSLCAYYDPGLGNGVAAANWQVEQRDPTQDKRIFEFCFGIPIEQYLVGGQSRSLIRRAMQGRLPNSTLRRTTRGLQSADWYLTVGAARPQLSAELTRIERSPLARRIVDTAKLRTLLDTWPTSGYHTSEVSDVWHLALTRGIAAGSFLALHDPEMAQDEPSPQQQKNPAPCRVSGESCSSLTRS
jgi:asparagine synthase (glutamine-hydrolysing)